MIKKMSSAFGCLVLIFTAGNASALQLTNRDTAHHTLVVTEIEGSQPSEVKAEPNTIIQGICLKGCTIKMPDGEEYEFDGNEVVSIEEGLIFMDGPFDYSEPSDPEGESKGSE